MTKHIVTLSDTSHPFTVIMHEEIKALKFDESDIEDINTKTARNQLFRDEADKRVTRYFVGQSGWVWFVHFIVDMPEEFDDTLPNMSKSLYRAKDGTTTLHMVSLHKTEQSAWDHINSDIRFNSDIDDGTLTHVYKLAEM